MPIWPDERLQHLEAAFDALDDAVMVVDQDLCIVAFNRAAEKLTGFSRQEALGSRCFEVCAGRFCRRICDIEGLFATHRPPADFESPVLAKDGRVRLVRVRTVPLKGRGERILAAVRILRDVTEEHGLRTSVGAQAGYGHLVGRSRPMLRLYEAIDAMRDSEAPILIQGPAGTEKEWVGRTLHELGLRAAGPFVALQTDGLPAAVLEERLLGLDGHAHAEGSQVVGLLHLAHQGTLFVDDVGDLPPRCVQAIDQHGAGGRSRAWPDVRLVVATARPPAELAASAGFSSAFAEALARQRLVLPPLVDRLDDVPLLAEKLLSESIPEGRPLPKLSREALARLMTYPFPGNVRELETVLRAATALAEEATIEAHHVVLPPARDARREASGVRQDGAIGTQPPGAPPPETLTREQLLRALEAHHWHVGRCARALGLHRTTLWRRMKRLAIERPADS